MATTNKTQPYGSHTTLLGLPAGVTTAEQLMKFRRREENEKFARRMKEASAGMQPGHALVFNQFAQLGKALGDKWMGNEAELTEQDKAGQVAVEQYNRFQDEAMSSPEYGKMDSQQQGFVHTESMIRALQASGQQDQALALAAQLHEQKLDYRVKMAQASKLEAEAAAEEAAAIPNAAQAAVDYHGSLYSDTERKQHRELLKSSDDMIKIGQTITDAFEKAENPADIVGNVGGMNRLAAGIGRFIEGGLSLANKLYDDNGEPTGSTVKDFIDKIPDSMVPERLRGTAAEASKYKAAIMRMVYADARLNEPGARQLSDADIENAMIRLGVDSNDPETVIGIFFDNMNDRLSGMTEQFTRIDNALSQGGHSGSLKYVYGTDVLSDIAAKQEKLGSMRGRDEKAVTTKPSPSSSPAQPTPQGGPAPLAPEDADLLRDVGIDLGY